MREERSGGKTSLARGRDIILIALVTLVLIATSLAVTLYLDAKENEDALQRSQDWIVLQLATGLVQIENGLMFSLNESYSVAERLDYSFATLSGFGSVFWSTRELMEMFDSSSRRYEVFQMVSTASSEVNSKFMEFVHYPLFNNITKDDPYEVNSTVVSVLTGVTTDLDEIRLEASKSDPEESRSKVSMMDLDVMYDAAARIVAEVTDL